MSDWPRWSAPAVCLGSGPSITAAQLRAVRRAHVAGLVKVIALNHMGLSSYAPWADLWYAADAAFWRAHAAEARASSSLRVAGEDTDIAQLRLRCHVTEDLELARAYVPGHVLHGGGAGHSGFQALQLAIGLGSPRVFLFGYDCRAVGAATNVFGRKPPDVAKPSPYASWVEVYRSLVIPPHVEVINCTPGSALDSYPARPFDLEAAA